MPLPASRPTYHLYALPLFSFSLVSFMSSFVTPLAFVLLSDKPAWLSGKWKFPYTSDLINHVTNTCFCFNFLKTCWPLAVITSLKPSFSLSVYYRRTRSFFRSFFKSMFSENPLDHAFLAPVCACACSVTQSCLTLCDPMDCSLPGSSVHGIFQAGILECLAISFSRGSSQCRDRTCVSYVSCFSR